MKKWVMSAGFIGMWFGPYPIKERKDGTHFVKVDGKRYNVGLKPLSPTPPDPRDYELFGYKLGEEVWHFA